MTAGSSLRPAHGKVRRIDFAVAQPVSQTWTQGETGHQAHPLQSGQLIHRHALSTRAWHWISAVLALMIFNAHPRL